MIRSTFAYLLSSSIILCLCFPACTKKNTPVPAKTPAPSKDIPVVPTPIAEKPHLPAKLASDNLIITFKYIGTSGNVTEIESSDGAKEIYMYKGENQLSKYERYEKKELKYSVFYVLDQDGGVTRGNQYKVESNGAVLTPTGNYRIEYDAEKRISKVSWYDNSKQLLREAIRTYNTDGTSLNITTTGQDAGVADYTFDNKKAWCRSIINHQILSIESLSGLLLSNTNNLSKISSSSTNALNKTYTYTYDTDNFPTSWIETDAKGSKKTFKLTYNVN